MPKNNLTKFKRRASFRSRRMRFAPRVYQQADRLAALLASPDTSQELFESLVDSLLNLSTLTRVTVFSPLLAREVFLLMKQSCVLVSFWCEQDPARAEQGKECLSKLESLIEEATRKLTARASCLCGLCSAD